MFAYWYGLLERKEKRKKEKKKKEKEKKNYKEKKKKWRKSLAKGRYDMEEHG